MPVLPSVTLSVGLLGSRGRPLPVAAVLGVALAARAAVADRVVWAMKSRRFRGGFIRSVSPVPRFRSMHPTDPIGRNGHTPSSRLESGGATRRRPRDLARDSNQLRNVLL